MRERTWNAHPKATALLIRTTAPASAAPAVLPLDEAREFFKSHNGRLLNLNKSVLSDEEKELIDIRRANIRKADRMYIALQQQTLGIAPTR